MLETYLLTGKNIVATAKRLLVHRNTLTYRLEKLSAMLNIDLTNVDDNMIVWLLISCIVLRSL